MSVSMDTNQQINYKEFISALLLEDDDPNTLKQCAVNCGCLFGLEIIYQGKFGFKCKLMYFFPGTLMHITIRIEA